MYYTQDKQRGEYQLNAVRDRDGEVPVSRTRDPDAHEALLRLIFGDAAWAKSAREPHEIKACTR